MKNYIYAFILFICLTFIISCSTKTSICTYPENQDCFICNLCAKYGIQPENISEPIETLNLLAIYKNKYKAEEVIKILLDTKEKLNSNISYIFIKEFYENIFKEYPELFILSKNYVSFINEFNSQNLIDERSKEILINWIDSIIKDMELISSLK